MELSERPRVSETWKRVDKGRQLFTYYQGKNVEGTKFRFFIGRGWDVTSKGVVFESSLSEIVSGVVDLDLLVWNRVWFLSQKAIYKNDIFFGIVFKLKEKRRRNKGVILLCSTTLEQITRARRFLFEYNCKENKLLKYYTITFKVVFKIELKE